MSINFQKYICYKKQNCIEFLNSLSQSQVGLVCNKRYCIVLKPIYDQVSLNQSGTKCQLYWSWCGNSQYSSLNHLSERYTYIMYVCSSEHFVLCFSLSVVSRKAESELQRATMDATRTTRQLEETIDDFEKQKIRDIKVLHTAHLLSTLAYF